MKYRRLLLKISGEALQNRAAGLNHDPDILNSVAQQFKTMLTAGAEIAVVVGGGNIFRGLEGVSAGTDRTTGDYMGMLATVINAMAIQSALENHGIQTRVMTAISMPSIAEPFIRRRAIRHLEKGRVVIFGAGTGNPYFTTDSAAALRASEINADVLMKATKVDGIYNADPVKNPDAVRYQTLTYTDALTQQLGVMDAAAFSLCMENDIPIIVFDFFKSNSMVEIFSGETSGTLVNRG
ncbi:MAG: UMP kinase [Kiritimatiellaceae bacterium]|nr:MAG: UMP kinase [Kiritimatiellaceae bacterium]